MAASSAKNDKTGQITRRREQLRRHAAGTSVWTYYSPDAGMEHREQHRRRTNRTHFVPNRGHPLRWADYNLVYTEGTNANKGVLDVGAWVSILNQSGASYEDARLKLVAGQVQRTAARIKAALRITLVVKWRWMPPRLGVF